MTKQPTAFSAGSVLKGEEAKVLRDPMTLVLRMRIFSALPFL